MQLIPRMPYRGPYREGYGPYRPRSTGKRDRYDSFPRVHPHPVKRSQGAKFSWVDGKSKLGPTIKDVEMLHRTDVSPASQALELSPEKAFTLADQALGGHVRKRIFCINDIGSPMSHVTKKRLPGQVFNELDKEFFRSMLQGNVSLGSADLAPGVLSQTSPAGRNGNPRIRIDLSPILFQYGQRLDIFAALIHQMVHAYYLQCCGHRARDDDGNGHDLEHEEHFLALLQCIGEHCEPLQRVLTADLGLPRSRHNDRFMDRHRLVESSGGSTSGASSCYSQHKGYSGAEIREWRDLAVAKSKSLQEAQEASTTSGGKNDKSFPGNVYHITKEGAEQPPGSFNKWELPREAYVLLQFDDRYYPVARNSVTDLSALTSSPYFKDRYYLELPQGTSHEDFLTLYFFLVHGAYPPSMKEINREANFIRTPNHGPPVIKPYDPNSPKQMVPLIAASQLGAELRYKPLHDHALQGLGALPSTAEDPIEALAKIYRAPATSQHSATPMPTTSAYSQLGDWVARWLQVALPAADWGQYGSTYKNNLNIVRCHPDWSEGFRQLKSKSSSVGEVETLVEMQLGLRCRDRIDIMKNPGSPELEYFNPGGQPYHIPQHFFVPKEGMPVHRSDNASRNHLGNHNTFDMSQMLQGLPLGFPGLHDQQQRPLPTALLPAQRPVAADLRQHQDWLQQQALRAESNPSNISYPLGPFGWFNSGMVDERPT
ncbi:MAG: hypothetical protein Q9224_005448, partial [Gallowayella concinna]